VNLPDVNVLIHAFRQDSSQHARSKAWLDATVSSEGRFGISTLVLSAVVRITTTPKIFRQPSTAEEALAYCGDLLGQPNCEVVTPGASHWSIFERLCLETSTSGPRTTDAWFAALAIEHGCRWITFDRDYARFPGLDCGQPDV
jgi:toxin-antitoxin system PIN domain toxin